MSTLLRPVVYSDPRQAPWLTVLTGDNVDLLPDAVRILLRDASDPVLPARGELRLLAFARTRIHGLAGISGKVVPDGDAGAGILVTRSFGRPDALASFGTAFGGYLAAPRRFASRPSVSWSRNAADPDPALVEALRHEGIAVDACEAESGLCPG